MDSKLYINIHKDADIGLGLTGLGHGAVYITIALGSMAGEYKLIRPEYTLSIPRHP